MTTADAKSTNNESVISQSKCRGWSVMSECHDKYCCMYPNAYLFRIPNSQHHNGMKNAGHKDSIFFRQLQIESRRDYGCSNIQFCS